MSNPARVALVVRPGENPQPFVDAIAHGAGESVVIESDTELPSDVGGLMVAGEAGFLSSDSLPVALAQAIDAGFPVLGIGWGMHALNIALGGEHPIAV
ncbi:MAG: C26 family cysteine hydrolase domain-containing family, partial [Chloroflexi bacterium]|nr:C26 family cysteine hydrolase domain-containing family [Chloroflexota bacterium]